MQESDDTTCEFLIASENASTPLEFVDKTFDNVAFSVADIDEEMDLAAESAPAST